jgi:catechol 2,3-dioxygenase-like lactoylglutathione lyase family enzyme
MPAFQRVMPVLRVADLERAVEWYTRVSGFGVCWRAANDDGGENCMLEAGETAVLLSTGAHLGETPAFTGTLYFEMKGVEEFYAPGEGWGRDGVAAGVDGVWDAGVWGKGFGWVYVGVCGARVRDGEKSKAPGATTAPRGTPPGALWRCGSQHAPRL